MRKSSPRIASVSPVMYGVLKLAWADKYEGVVDLRPVLASGEVFEFLRKSPQRFMDVRLGEHGHRIFWVDDVGDEIDFGAESLRRDAERQAEVHRLMRA
jgi:hypothetical protein